MTSYRAIQHMDMVSGGGYNANVRARALLTAALSLLLFSMSCWASACDLSCSLDALGPGCEGTNASQPNQQQAAPMADMQMSHGQMGDMAKAGNVLLRSHPSRSCAHESCDQTALSGRTVPSVDRPQVSHVRSVVVFALRVARPSLHLQWTRDETPPPRNGADRPLSISLRI